MLFPLLFMSLVCQGLSVKSYGKDFITAFPENIAYYHPRESNTLQINAFYDGTDVTITTKDKSVYRGTLQSGQTKVVHFPKDVEQYQFTRSFYSVRVTSNNWITVLWISQRGDSVQSNYVQPVKNLGKLYSVPFLNYNKMMGSLYDRAELLALDNWRCIIINAEDITNNVIIETVSLNVVTAFKLSPYELFQFQTNGSEIKVNSGHAVAVLLTHPCVKTTRCDCNMVVNHVLPQNLWGQNFVVPSLKNLNSTWLQVTSTTEVLLKGQNITILVSNSSNLNPFPYLGSSSQFITAPNNVSIRLISPGLILELMPEAMFAACYLLQMNSTEGEAFIIAQTDSRAKVYIDTDLLPSSDWRAIDSSIYSSISVPLSGTHVIWHPTSRIGVYMFERMESGIPYGGPAVILNDEPDRDGCVADPALFKTTTDVLTWPESLDYCSNATFQMSTPTSLRAQNEMINFLKKDGGPWYFWIGLRRSLFTLEWYWKNGNDSDYNVAYTKWDVGHPVVPQKALCASVSQDGNKQFSWKSVSCCSKKRPLCYKKAYNFNDLTFDAL